MSCPDCFKGSERTDTTPTGKVTTLHGLPTYIAEPAHLQGRDANGLVVIIPDAFGWEFVNNRLLADEYAQKGGFTVYMPDFMNGNACPLWVIEPLDSIMRAGSLMNMFLRLTVFRFGPFIYQNRQSVTMPRVTNFLTELRKAEAADLPVGVAGFCWGGLHAIHLAAEPPSNSNSNSNSKALVDVIFTAHPSSISFPAHIEQIKANLHIHWRSGPFDDSETVRRNRGDSEEE